MTTTATPDAGANASAAYTVAEVTAAVGRGLVAANDRPNPTLDATRSAQQYAALAENFRSGAWKHLDEGDLPQAANKAWGLVAETLKAIGAQHGGFIHSHRGIVMVGEELARLAGSGGDGDLQRWIINALNVAQLLHANFYENGSSEDEVLAGLMQCEELAERLHTLFWPAGRAAVC